MAFVILNMSLMKFEQLNNMLTETLITLEMKSTRAKKSKLSEFDVDSLSDIFQLILPLLRKI